MGCGASKKADSTQVAVPIQSSGEPKKDSLIPAGKPLDEQPNNPDTTVGQPTQDKNNVSEGKAESSKKPTPIDKNPASDELPPVPSAPSPLKNQREGSMAFTRYPSVVTWCTITSKPKQVARAYSAKRAQLGQEQGAAQSYGSLPSVVSWLPVKTQLYSSRPSVVSWLPIKSKALTPASKASPARVPQQQTKQPYGSLPSVVSWLQVQPAKQSMSQFRALPSVVTWMPATSKGRVKHTLILIRHGESQWNVENRFTGWVDVPLAPTGEAESHRAAAAIQAEKLSPDVVYTSVLKRAIKTAMNVVEDLDLMHVPMLKDWRLNERHYGALQGLNKAETVAKHGEDKVNVWRRSYDTPPPDMGQDHEFWSGNDKRYQALSSAELPTAESLKTVVDRFMPLWSGTLAPAIMSGRRVMVAAHGNTLRALVKHLDNVPEETIAKLNIPTAVPLVYELDEDLRPIRSGRSWAPLSGYYLGDQEEIAKAINGVAAQSQAKK